MDQQALQPSAFDVAAAVCGHDTATVVGAENARHDRRVWDLLDERIDSTLTESLVFLAAHRQPTVADHIAAARHALHRTMP